MFEKQNDFHQLNKQLVCNNGAYDQRMVSIQFLFLILYSNVFIWFQVNNVFANENLLNASKETTFVWC